jgi:hypothetical protein
VSNHLTTEADVDRSVDAILRVWRDLRSGRQVGIGDHPMLSPG